MAAPPAGAPTQPIDDSCTTALQAAVAGADHASHIGEHPADIWPIPDGYIRTGIPENGGRIFPVLLPTRCVEAFLTDVHAEGVSSTGGDEQLVTDGLVACRSAGPNPERSAFDQPAGSQNPEGA